MNSTFNYPLNYLSTLQRKGVKLKRNKKGRKKIKKKKTKMTGEARQAIFELVTGQWSGWAKDVMSRYVDIYGRSNKRKVS